MFVITCDNERGESRVIDGLRFRTENEAIEAARVAALAFASQVQAAARHNSRLNDTGIVDVDTADDAAFIMTNPFTGGDIIFSWCTESIVHEEHRARRWNSRLTTEEHVMFKMPKKLWYVELKIRPPAAGLTNPPMRRAYSTEADALTAVEQAKEAIMAVREDRGLTGPYRHTQDVAHKGYTLVSLFVDSDSVGSYTWEVRRGKTKE